MLTSVDFKKEKWRNWYFHNLVRGVHIDELNEILHEKHGSCIAKEMEAAVSQDPFYELICSYLGRQKRLEQYFEMRLKEAKTLQDYSRYSLDSKAFLRHYRRNHPFVWRGAARSWPALAWSVEQWALSFPDLPIEAQTTSPHASRLGGKPTSVSMAYFQQGLHKNELQIVGPNHFFGNEQFSKLLGDIETPASFFEKPHDLNTFLWCSGAQHETPLHHDLMNVFFVQLRGQKRFWLGSPWLTPLLNVEPSVYSAKKMDEVSSLGQFVDLTPGDGLFIPVGWWHWTQNPSNKYTMGLSFHGIKKPNHFDFATQLNAPNLDDKGS